jgi:hypothetical protein
MDGLLLESRNVSVLGHVRPMTLQHRSAGLIDLALHKTRHAHLIETKIESTDPSA